MPSTQATRWLGLIALISTGFDLVVFVVLHLAQPDVDVLQTPTSAYVHGALGFASPLASAAVGVGGLALAVAAWLATSAAGARIGAALLAVFGLAKLLQAFFPIDQAAESTSTGAIHNLLGNIAFFVLPVAAVLVTRAVARATGRATPPWWPTVAGWALVATTALVLAGDGLGFFGLAQRIYLVSAMAWTAALAWWLRRARK